MVDRNETAYGKIISEGEKHLFVFHSGIPHSPATPKNTQILYSLDYLCS
jgi:hypothetical protein